MNIYKVEDSTEVFGNKEYATEIKEFDYIFSPESTNQSYVFVTEKYHNLLGLNDGLKQIVDEILNLSIHNRSK